MLGIPRVTGVLLALGLVFMPWCKVGYGFRLRFDMDGTVGEGEVKPLRIASFASNAFAGALWGGSSGNTRSHSAMWCST